MQNAALDVAIGLILMYLMLSLLCTIINEYIASKLKLRAANLAAGLQEILDDPWVRDRFYAHGLIAGPRNAVGKSDNLLGALVRKLGNLPAAVAAAPVPPAAAAAPPAAPGGPPAAPPPHGHLSYIASTNFALALLGSLDTSQPVPGFADVEATVNAMNDSKLKTALLSALATANNDLDQFRRNVATWFDDSMERLSGAYKRHLKLITMVIGVIVAVGFNADSFHVASTLWTDSDLRAHIAATAAEVAKKAPPADSTELQKELKVTDGTRALPIGWHCEGDTSLWPCAKDKLYKVTLLQILGWFLTAMALSLGAPFWFDLLSKFINIRGAGVKPQRADARA